MAHNITRTGAGALALALALSVSAAAQGLNLGVGASQAVYHPGDRLELTIAATNAGGGPVADFYAGVLLPDGVTLVTLGAGGAARIGSLARPADFLPVAAGIGLAGPFAVAVDPFFQYVWTGSEPRGTYVIFLAAARPGAFADNRIDPDDVLGLRTGTLSLRDPAVVTVEGGPPVTVNVTDQGGVVSVTAGSGQTLALSVPPAAVARPTAISAIPVAQITGLPMRRLLGAVRFGPDGLRLRQPATLTVPLPAGGPRAGLVGFSVKNDGTGYELHPVTIAGNVATVRISHFSAAGVAQMVCGTGVTSAVGLAACARMNQNLTEAAVMVEDLQDFPMPVRVLLAAEIIQELHIWMNTFILPELRTAANPANTDPTVHYFMLVALREKSEVEAILQLTEMLDPASGIAAELTELGTLVPAAIDARRLVANQQCLQDKPNYRTHLNRIIEIAAIAETLALPVDPATHGVTCVVVELGVQLTGVVPTSGSTFVAGARAGFSDGTSLPDQLAVMLEAFNRGALLGTPTFVQGLGTVTLSTTVAPLTATGPGPKFDLLAEVPELGLSRSIVVDRPHRVLVTSSVVTGTKLLRAGQTTSQLSLSDPTRVILLAETIFSTSPPGTAALNISAASVATNPAATTISGDGDFTIVAGDDARSRVSFTTRLVATLRGDYFCRFDLTTTEFSIGAATSFTWRVLRNGAVHFVTTSSKTVITDCDDGAYVVELDTSADVSNPPPPAGSSARTYSFEIMLVPKIGP